MATLVLLSLLVLLPLLPVNSQTQYSLNTTAYSSYFNSSCFQELDVLPYPSSCSPFTSPSLWIPYGVPDSNSIVNVTSVTPLSLVISNATSFFRLTKLSLVGSVILVVQGNISLSALIVCDTSGVTVQFNGSLASSSTAFFDNSTLLHAGGSISMDNIVSNGSDVFFWFSEGYNKVVFGNVSGTIQQLTIEGNTHLTSLTSIIVNDLDLGDAYRYSYVNASITVLNSAGLVGKQFYLRELKAKSDASVTMLECPNIDSVVAEDSSDLDIHPMAICTMNSMTLRDQSTATVFTGNTFTLLNLNQLNGSGMLYFEQPEYTYVETNIFLQTSNGPSFIHFSGIFNVTAGVVGQDSFVFGQMYMDEGNSTLNALNVMLAPGFDMYPELQTVVLSNGLLSLSIHLLLPSYNFIWQPYGTVVIGDDGRIEANDLQLSDGKTIILNNSNDDGSGDSLAINTLHIGPGASVVARSNTNSMNGSLTLNGTLSLEPRNESSSVLLFISGGFNMERTAKLSLPQSVQFGHSNSSYTYLSVLGEVNLEGELNVTLGGKLPASFSSNNYSTTITIMNATNFIRGKFHSFSNSLTRSLSDATKDGLALSYELASTAVYLKVEPHGKKENGGDTRRIWAAVGGSIVGIVLFVILMAAVTYIVKKRLGQNQYRQIQS